MDEVVVTTPSPLDRLADQVRDALRRQELGREAWIAATLDLFQHLAEARVQMPGHYEFGRWCDAQGFGLSHQDRAAAIEMGRYLDDARQVLQATQRRSIRHIYSREFRLTHVGKTLPELPPSPPRLPKTKLMSEPAWRKAKAKMRAEIEAEVRAEVAKRMRELDEEVRQRVVERGKKYRENMEAAEREAAETKRWHEQLINNHKPPLTNDEFLLLHLCVRGQASEDKQHAAGVLLNQKRPILTGQKR